MINLLPPQEKRELQIKRTITLVSVLGTIGVVGVLTMVLVLLALKFYVLVNVNSHQIFLDKYEKKYFAADGTPLKDVIKKYNGQLTNIQDFYRSDFLFTDAFRPVVDVNRPSGVTFDSLILERISPDSIKVTITGKSTTRNNLLALKDNLIDSPQIKNVYFPPESWIKPSDVDFTATLEVIKP